MTQAVQPVRVLYSFPHRLGAARICHTAWQQVYGVMAAGAHVTVCAGSLSRELPPEAVVKPTLARGRFRIPYRVLGTERACALHDAIVAHRLEKLAGKIDVVHAWPLGSLRTLRTAARLGIPTVLERPNAHTRFAYEVVRKECEKLGIVLDPNHEHAYKPGVLAKEEAEYDAAFRLLCPSDFVARTFVDEGFSTEKLVRDQYGYDETVYHSGQQVRDDQRGLTMIFVGGVAPRKGLHYALEAWLQSPASRKGKFTIVGAFVPGYAEKMSAMLAHPSVEVLGHRSDVPELMRKADLLVLPSIEEGSALVTSEARASGCVLVVSDAAGAICRHMENALVHPAGDVEQLTEHLTLLDADRNLLERLRNASLRTADEITWKAAGRRLLAAYHQTIAEYRQSAGALRDNRPTALAHS
ncbi:MAG TPA: glycosyltransferase family 4 protein [Acidobacteriaceae bacterium]|jgi:glycosyltransferase involved in cell wall biosynthesis|nr:glycosyltransferase family 4 protein [Acidobacteriaceae bacterium]